MEILEKKKYILFLPGIFIEDCLEDIIDNPDLQPELLEELDSEEEPEKKLAIELNYFLEYEDKKSVIEEKVEKYEPIPKYFIDIKYSDVKKSWPLICNLLCSYCHMSFNNIPIPIALNKIKLLIPDDDEINIPDKLKYDYAFEKDDSIDSNMREVKAYKLHNIAFCSIAHAVSYIKKINDYKINNKKESLQMTLQVYKQITGKELIDITEKDLWIVMKQYCGDSGQSKTEYLHRTNNI